MAVRSVEIGAFRCIAEARLDLHRELNLIVGENASGKTSLLEALFFVGRGRSFRSPSTANLIRRGEVAFRVVAALDDADDHRRVGVEYGRAGFRLRVDGEDSRRLSDLAGSLAVAAVDPDVHALVQGTPEGRRRFVDWGVFHVEQDFLRDWQRYQRALRQRNAALRAGVSDGDLRVWTAELAPVGEALAAARDRYLSGFASRFEAVGGHLLQRPVGCWHLRGWPRDRALVDALTDGEVRDRQFGATQTGPHRADLALQVDGRAVRDTISRGQQKALASALVLAQISLFCEQTGRRALLLLDDPAAELDRAFLARLLELSIELPVQLVVTGLTDDGLPVDRDHARFHVEQGKVVQVL